MAGSLVITAASLFIAAEGTCDLTASLGSIALEGFLTSGRGCLAVTALRLTATVFTAALRAAIVTALAAGLCLTALADAFFTFGATAFFVFAFSFLGFFILAPSHFSLITYNS
jgi:hypothetical protein